MSRSRLEGITLPLAQLAGELRQGKRDARGLLESAYASIERHGARPAWVSTRPIEEALATLERLSRSTAELPLFGLPIGVKDNIDVAGLPTTAGCPAFSYVPQASAAVVERLERAGAIVVGKTNLDQFATGLVGTRSPYGACSSVFDERYISGGSSSGSAVALARGDVAFTLGTDTAGSGRVPAAFNELVGLKPTRGLLSSRGVVPACRSLDCVSVFAHTLDDAEFVLGIAQGYDELDPFSRRAPAYVPALPAKPRIGVPTRESLEFFGDGESAELFARAVEQLRGLPAELVPVDLGPFRRAAALLYEGPWVAERLAAIGDFAEQHPQALEPVLSQILAGAKQHSARAAYEASYRLAALRRETEAVWQTIDALLVPTAPTHYTVAEVLAEPLELNQNLGTYTNFVNLLDLSGLALPAGSRKSGLPFGVTLLAPAFHEARLLSLGRRFAGVAEPARAPRPGAVWLAVAGAHLAGQPLNRELVTRGASLIRVTSTSDSYRLYALDTQPPKPGLTFVGDGAGSAIEVEVWELGEEAFGSFVRDVPAPMAIGTTRLADGSLVKGFVCEPYALEGARDISAHGGWRRYLAERSKP